MSSFNDWLSKTIGTKTNPDNDGSFDCVDVFESWCKYIWPANPFSTETGWGNAKDLYANSSSTYFTKIPYVSGLNPRPGDVIVYGATASNPYGHIAVVISATSTSVTVIQQNSYTQQAAYKATLGYSHCIGFLRPKYPLSWTFPKTVWCKVAWLNVRSKPSTSAPVVKHYILGSPIKVINQTTGTSVSGISKWYKTADGYWLWSGGVKG